jgi:hypothetical protein
MAVLPTCMLGILLLFYGWMWAEGMDIEEARERGWIGEAEPAGDWTETWKYIDFSSVRWEAMPQQFVTMVSMTLVVALSSCLDVAAIELELGKKLDYDHEVSGESAEGAPVVHYDVSCLPTSFNPPQLHSLAPRSLRRSDYQTLSPASQGATAGATFFRKQSSRSAPGSGTA